MGMEEGGITLVKIGSLVIMLVSTFMAGVSPYFCRWNHGFLVLGTQFAGGVFLSTAIIHFLSDSDRTFRAILNHNHYPFAFMLATVGYVLTISMDALVQCRSLPNPTPLPPSIPAPPTSNGVCSMGGTDILEQNMMPPQERKSTSSSIGYCLDLESHCHSNNYTIHPCEDGEVVTDPDVEAKSNIMTLAQQTTFGDTILLIFALCTHSIFEGIAVGIAKTKGGAWKALWTISLHKIFAAIAMGIALLRLIPNRSFLSCAIYALAFAISSPIGVAIGIVISATTEGNAMDWTYAISMGFASGIFIYVAVNHLLAKGYVPPCNISADKPLFKFLANVLGAGIIAFLMRWD